MEPLLQQALGEHLLATHGLTLAELAAPKAAPAVNAEAGPAVEAEIAPTERRSA